MLLSASPLGATETVTYTYDALGRLTASSTSTGPTAGTASVIQYDPAGNRTNQAVTGAPSGGVVESVIVLPINGFTVIPIIAASYGGQPVPAPSSVSFSVTAQNAPAEGQPAVFTITKSSALNQPLQVSYATSNGTAAAPGDYTTTTGTITFLGWETVRTVPVPTIDDASSEPAETFSLTISAASGGSTIGTASATAQIPQNTFNNPPVAVGDNISLAVCTIAAKNVLANDSDPDGHPISLVSASTSSNLGTVSVDGTQVVFAAAGGTGTASVSYVIQDSLGKTATGTLGVQITGQSGPCP